MSSDAATAKRLAANAVHYSLQRAVRMVRHEGRDPDFAAQVVIGFGLPETVRHRAVEIVLHALRVELAKSDTGRLA